MMNMKNVLMLVCGFVLLFGVTCACKPNMVWKPKKRVTFDSEFVVYGTMRCGYTVKMCDHLKNTGRTFDFVDVRKDTDRYVKELRRFGVESSGVPFVVHKPSDTYFIGFKAV